MEEAEALLRGWSDRTAAKKVLWMGMNHSLAADVRTGGKLNRSVPQINLLFD